MNSCASGRPVLGLLGEQARHDLARGRPGGRLQLQRVARLRVQDLVDERRDRLARKRARAASAARRARRPARRGRSGRRASRPGPVRATCRPGCRSSGPCASGRTSTAAVNLPIPKSVTFTRPSRATRMLPGLMSRWSTPRSCACAERLGGLADDRDLGRERQLVAALRGSASAACRRRTPSR